MPMHVCSGATLQCSFGSTPSSLLVVPVNRMLTSAMPAANILDHVPLVNVLPFGTCISLANPTVAAATSAAGGALTPMPCVPVTTSPWVPGAPTVLLGNMPALDDTSRLICTWGGVISVVYAGQAREQIP